MSPLPHLTDDLAPLGATFEPSPQDFFVDEIPAYAAAGEGDHLFVRIEKRDLTTREALKRIAMALDISKRDIGYAGLKDRHATTRQWLSLPGITEAAAKALVIEGLSVLDATLHTKKLRTGHLAGNRFRMLLRDCNAERIELAREVLDVLERDGMPNYFGPQRFGKDGDNAVRAKAWVRGETKAPRKHFERKFLVSALQSELFNQCVADRVRNNALGRVYEGDIMQRVPKGGLFTSTDVAVDQPRADAWEISPTGPMFGADMRWPQAVASERERTLLADNGLSIDDFARVKRSGPGTRRLVRVRPQDVAIGASDEALVLEFTLPAGSYATVLLEELLKRDAAITKPS